MLAVVCLAQLMITLDITIVNIALPAAQRDLGFSDAQRQWVITAYALAFGSLLLISGRITDRIGRRNALLIGLVIFGAIAALGGALGLLLGGLLTEHLNWRWTLYVNLLIAAITLLGTVVFVDRDVPAKWIPIDMLGTGLVTAGLFGVVFGFSRAVTSGWSAPATWGTLVISAVLLGAFGWWQTRATNPLLSSPARSPVPWST